MLLLLLACGTVSNDIFLEDQAFLAALPTRDAHSLDVDEESSATKAETGEVPSLLRTTWEVSAGVNLTVAQLLGAIDSVRQHPPTSRAEDARTWGPYPWDDQLEVSLTMTRRADTYGWELLGQEHGKDAVVFASGQHFAGETVAAGDGAFSYDITTVAEWFDIATTGELVVDYDLRDGKDLVADILGGSQDGAEPTDSAYAYRLVEDEGDFQYTTPFDLEWDASDEMATVEVRTRWVRGQGGRADARVTGGGLGNGEYTWSQCWNGSLGLSYQGDSEGYVEPVGTEADCAFPEAAEIDRI